MIKAMINMIIEIVRFIPIINTNINIVSLKKVTNRIIMINIGIKMIVRKKIIFRFPNKIKEKMILIWIDSKILIINLIFLKNNKKIIFRMF